MLALRLMAIGIEAIVHASFIRLKAFVTSVSDLPPKWAARIAVTESGCWEMSGWNTGDGYAKVRYRGRCMVAHRAIYSKLVHDPGRGYLLDHRCRNRRCVRPYHMEPVTAAENTRRGNAVLFKRKFAIS